jgi:hypothetical protein
LIGKVSQWPDLGPTAEADRKAVELIGRCLDDVPPGLALAGEPSDELLR